MAGTLDTLQAEKKLASQEARKLRRAFKSAIDRSVNVSAGGPTKKATVRSKFKAGRLDRLTFVAPHYIFKQHHGFEGVKSNGVHMRLKATNVLSKAIVQAGSLSALADGLSNIRAEEVMARINFDLKV